MFGVCSPKGERTVKSDPYTGAAWLSSARVVNILRPCSEKNMKNLAHIGEPKSSGICYNKSIYAIRNSEGSRGFGSRNPGLHCPKYAIHNTLTP